MKNFHLAVFALCIATAFNSNANLTLEGRAVLNRQIRADKCLTIDQSTHQIKSVDKQSQILAIVEYSDKTAIEQIIEMGCEVRHESDGFLIAIIPTAKLEDVATITGVDRVSPARKLSKKLDVARGLTKANAIHSGSGLPKAYDGTGVVVGLMDFGVEPNHISFRNSSGTGSRIKGVTYFIGNPEFPAGNPEQGIPAYQKNVYSTAGQITSFATDNGNDSHGTLALGALAGSYTGNGYYGMAKNSDIYVSCGSTYDANILEGIEDIAKYAKRVNKPCVINLSLGSNLGPHDGTDAFDKSLAKIIKNYNIPICVAAGNEGADKMSIIRNFATTYNTFSTFVMDNEYVGKKGNFISGGVDIWGNSNQAFTVQLGIYNISTNTMIYNMPAISASTYGAYQYVSSSKYASTGDYTPSVMNTAYPDGYFGVASEVDPASKRYHVHIDLSAINAAKYKAGVANNYRISIKVNGNHGQSIYMFCDDLSIMLSSENVAGYINGNGDCSISNESCAEGVISVGSFDSRNKYVDIAGREWDAQDVTLYGITRTSSYGTKFGGNKLPHVCAPGNIVVTTANNNNINSLISLGVIPDVNKLPAKASGDYWNIASGTSISSPIAAGIIALWLQANPNLTSTEIMEIINTTSQTDTYTIAASSKFGAGKIDALAGIKKAIQMGGVDDVIDDGKKVMVENGANGHLRVISTADENFDVVIYNLSGQEVASAKGRNGEASVDVAQSGIYLTRVHGVNSSTVTKIVVK